MFYKNELYDIKNKVEFLNSDVRILTNQFLALNAEIKSLKDTISKLNTKIIETKYIHASEIKTNHDSKGLEVNRVVEKIMQHLGIELVEESIVIREIKK